MSFPLGIGLAILVGDQAVPTPLGPELADLLIETEIVELADGQSTFRLTFGAKRAVGGLGPEVAVLADGRVAVGNRVVVIALDGALPVTLIDGLVTDIWLDPGSDPAQGRIAIGGADLSVAMDLTERIVGYPDMDEEMIVLDIVARYARFAILPEAVPPLDSEFPVSIERTPIQHGTDLAYLYRLADRFGYVFTVRPGAVPLTNVAYWGPPKRIGLPAPALTIGANGFGNVGPVAFTLDGRAAFTVAGFVSGPLEETPALYVDAPEPTLLPPLALRSPYPIGAMLGTKLPTGPDGYSEIRAQGSAQGRVNAASTRIARAEGTLDVEAYGAILRSGGLVGVRGAGIAFDGDWSVEQVTHRLRAREFTQAFVLVRDGSDPIAPLVVP